MQARYSVASKRGSNRHWRNSHPAWMRRLALIATFAFLWTFLIAAPLQAWAQPPAPKQYRHSAPLPNVKRPKPIALLPPASLKQNMRPLTPRQIKRLYARVGKRPAGSPSLLDQVGHLAHPVRDSQFAAWKRLLHKPHLPAVQAARLHLWLGEMELAKYEQPQRALEQFA